MRFFTRGKGKGRKVIPVKVAPKVMDTWKHKMKLKTKTDVGAVSEDILNSMQDDINEFIRFHPEGTLQDTLVIEQSVDDDDDIFDFLRGYHLWTTTGVSVRFSGDKMITDITFYDYPDNSRKRELRDILNIYERHYAKFKKESTLKF